MIGFIRNFKYSFKYIFKKLLLFNNIVFRLFIFYP